MGSERRLFTSWSKHCCMGKKCTATSKKQTETSLEKKKTRRLLRQTQNMVLTETHVVSAVASVNAVAVVCFHTNRPPYPTVFSAGKAGLTNVLTVNYEQKTDATVAGKGTLTERGASESPGRMSA